MENFGLGLIVGFQDNASEGIEKILSLVQRLQEQLNNVSSGNLTQTLEGMSGAMSVVGAAATGMGLAITGAVGSAIKSTVEMGGNFERQMIALQQMYGSVEEGRKRFLDFQRIAAETPFSFQDIVPIAERFKSLGIEADKTFNIIDHGRPMTRDLLSLIGDMAAIRPDKGLETVAREATEFVEGNARPLKMSFGMDIPKILGEEMGATEAERVDQFARAVAKRGYAGMSERLQGSWQVIFSNLKDNFDRLAFFVNDAGIFEEVKKPFKDLYEYMNKLFQDEDKAKTLGKAISDGMKMVIAPARALADVLFRAFTAFVRFAENNPRIVSMTIGLVGLGGQLLTIAGIITLSVGLYAKFRAALTALVGTTPLLRAFFGTMRMGLFGMMRAILPVTIAVGLLYYAFRNNIFGIRTLVVGGIGTIVDVLSVLADAFTHVDVEHKKFSLSAKNAKIAENLGLIPIIKQLVAFEHYIIMFGRGLAYGFSLAEAYIRRASQSVIEFLDSIARLVKGTPIEKPLQNLRQKITSLIDPNTQRSVVQIGTQIGKWGTFALAAVAGFSTLRRSVSLVRFAFSPLSGVVSTLARGFARLFTAFRFNGMTGLRTAFSRMFPNISGLINRIVPPLRTLGTFLGNFMSSTLNGIANLLVNFRSVVTTHIRSLGRFISNGFVRFWGVISRLPQLMANALNGIVSHFTAFRGRIFSFFTSLHTGILGRITAIRSIFANGLIQGLRTILHSGFTGIIRIASTFLRGLAGLFTSNPIGLALLAIGVVIMLVIKYWDEFQAAVERVWGHIQNTVRNAVIRLQPVFQRLGEAFNSLADKFPFIAEIVGAIWDFITGKSEEGSAVASAIFEALGTAISVIFDFIVMVIEIAITVISGLIEGLIGVFNGIVKFLTAVFKGDVKGALDAIVGIFKSAFGAIADIVSGVAKAVSGFVDDIMGKTAQAKESAQEAQQIDNNVSMGDFKKLAIGGIFPKGEFVTKFAEDYPEAAIPINTSKRSRDLWKRTGIMLGMLADTKENRGGENVMFTSSKETVVNPLQEVTNIIQPRESTGNIISAPNISVPPIGGLGELFNPLMGFFSGVLSSLNTIIGIIEEKAPVVQQMVQPVIQQSAPVVQSVAQAVPSTPVVNPVVSVRPNISVQQASSPAPQSSGGVNVTFANGAIQLNITSSGEVNARSIADELMPILKRKIQLDRMINRGGAFA